jgi:four helix bundle protein
VFDHEKLEVYQLQLEFVSWVTPLLAKVREGEPRLGREVTDQLDRASLSLLLNTAEGNGKRQRRVRAKFLDDARGSTMECAACLDALVAKGLSTQEQVQTGKLLLHRIVSMLTKLVERFDREEQMGDGCK